jgi:hypothetical protein
MSELRGELVNKIEEEELQSDVDSTQEDTQSDDKEDQPKIFAGTKIIRKYDVDYNIFMKLGRTIKYRAKLKMENET